MAKYMLIVLSVEEGIANFAQDRAHLHALKDYAMEKLSQQVPILCRIGTGEAPHILALSLPGYKSEVVVRMLSDLGVYISSGSACHKGKPSHVFAALGLPKRQLDGVLRISFSTDTLGSGCF